MTDVLARVKASRVPDPPAVPLPARRAILAWYGRVGRPLPFRAASDAYGVLVSEYMAQQTQAARAGDSWRRFMARFPSVESLAAAPPADVIRAWQGLGYNRRALNLWRAARQLVERHDGCVPADLAALEALPGVGPYTARAVASIAFGKPVGAVDTNVRRVLSRMVLGEDATTGNDIQAIADASVPVRRAAAWTHALMDVGARHCRPREPDCEACPARPWCRFAAHGRTVGRPVRMDRSGRTPPPFRATSRWLRGRIVERLRETPPDCWAAIDGSIGDHPPAAVQAAILALAKEGLVEARVGEQGAVEARLPPG